MLSLSSTGGDTPAVDQTPLEREIAELLVSVLNLPLIPSAIPPSERLYGDGLGLDSIDLLEIAMEITGRYGFQLRSDEEKNAVIFASIRSLAEHVDRHRAK